MWWFDDAESTAPGATVVLGEPSFRCLFFKCSDSVTQDPRTSPEARATPRQKDVSPFQDMLMFGVFNRYAAFARSSR